MDFKSKIPKPGKIQNPKSGSFLVEKKDFQNSKDFAQPWHPVVQWNMIHGLTKHYNTENFESRLSSVKKLKQTYFICVICLCRSGSVWPLVYMWCIIFINININTREVLMVSAFEFSDGMKYFVVDRSNELYVVY